MNFLIVRIYSTDHRVGLRFSQPNRKYIDVLKRHIIPHEAKWNKPIKEWFMSLDKVYLATIVANELGVPLSIEAASKVH